MTDWLIAVAMEGDAVIGGAIVARGAPEYELVEGGHGSAALVDIRVNAGSRGCGIGRLLFAYVARSCREFGCRELLIETQDVNVSACRFYQAMGCSVHSITEQAYGPDLDEARIIWRLEL